MRDVFPEQNEKGRLPHGSLPLFVSLCKGGEVWP